MSTPLKLHGTDDPAAQAGPVGPNELSAADLETAAEWADAPCEDPPRVVELLDGWLVDVATGEVLGLAGVPDVLTIRDRDSADVVLERLARLDGLALAIDARERAVTAAFARERRALALRREWWEKRFGYELREYARAELTASGWKRKTWSGTYGSVEFRTLKGSNRITDVGRAVELAEAVLPSVVKRPPPVVGLTDFQAVVKELERAVAAGDPFAADFLAEARSLIETSGAGEKVSISSGVK